MNPQNFREENAEEEDFRPVNGTYLRKYLCPYLCGIQGAKRRLFVNRLSSFPVVSKVLSLLYLDISRDTTEILPKTDIKLS